MQYVNINTIYNTPGLKKFVRKWFRFIVFRKHIDTQHKVIKLVLRTIYLLMVLHKQPIISRLQRWNVTDNNENWQYDYWY